jgi:hypothetical protein
MNRQYRQNLSAIRTITNPAQTKKPPAKGAHNFQFSILDRISESTFSKFFFTNSKSGMQKTGSNVMMLKPCLVTITIDAANITTSRPVKTASAFFRVILRL